MPFANCRRVAISGESEDLESKALTRPSEKRRRLAPRRRKASSSKRGQRTLTILRILGPGLITGAADDDPSGIATYSSVGAQFGYAMLWTMPFIYPFMTAIQEISARIGRVTGRGISANLRRCYPRWLLYVILGLLLFANVINLGADIGAMAAALNLMIGGPTALYCVLFAAISLVLQVWIPYQKYAGILKWMTLSLFAYVATAFVVRIDWAKAIQGTLIPRLSLSPEYLQAVVPCLEPPSVLTFSFGNLLKR
jgi:NRAMP (natural resistance-associated macrophage protein)-like metal ion transporter